MFTDQQRKQLNDLLSPDRVEKRDGMSYIMAWDATYTANEIFGFDGWDRETTEMRLVQEATDQKNQHRVGYVAKVRITVRAGETVIVREGTGAGQGINRDLFKAHEGATKEAESDAMKRALTQFGSQFGLALYDKQQRNVGYSQDNYSDELTELTDALAAVQPDDCPSWMQDNLKAIQALDESEQLIIRRMCNTKLAQRKQAA